MKSLRSALFPLISLAALGAGAVSPYSDLQTKVGRLTEYGEWASAAAVYDLMLHERPDVAQTYGQAITVNGIRGDSIAQIRLMNMALDNHMPFDSVFSQVKQWSFYWSKPQVYENFLMTMRSANPWMRRTIDSTLLRYYTFRRNGPKMVAYADVMLAGAPDNPTFLQTKANGYLLSGNDADALAIFNRLLEADPNNYDILVTLGNWYAEHRTQPGASALAREYLQRADAIRSTPYVTSLLTRL